MLCPVQTAVWRSGFCSFSYFVPGLRLLNIFPPLHHVHMHLLSLCLPYTYTHPQHLLVKIKHLESGPTPYSSLLQPLSPACGTSLIRRRVSTHPYVLINLPFAQMRSVSLWGGGRGTMQLFSSPFLLLLLLLLKQMCSCLPGANLTSNLDRIKIVFTPMLCRRVCSSGRCYNSCEKGDVTTVYSETSQHHHQQQQPKNQGFRLCECWLPALNSWISSHWLIYFASLFLQCLFCLLSNSHTHSMCLHSDISFLFYEVSWTKWIPSSMMSVPKTKLKEQAEWCRLNLSSKLKTYSPGGKKKTEKAWVKQ